MRGSTRLAAIVGKMARKSGHKAVRIPIESIARTLRYSPETVRKLTMRLRTSPWFFKGYHTIIFITHQTSDDCPRGFPVLWAINRHHSHRIYAHPGVWRQLRWHWRKGHELQWAAYTRRIFLWARAMMLSKENTSDGKHKGFSQQEGRERAASARSPPNKSTRLRRFEKVAVSIELAYRRLPAAPRASIKGWCVNRLTERHGFAQIVSALRHAVDRFQRRGKFAVTCAPPWICAVAKYRLDQDGLVPSQRRVSWKAEAASAALALNDDIAVIDDETNQLDESRDSWYTRPNYNGGLWHGEA